MGAPIEIGRDEARRRAEEELARAKYQGMPEWLADLLQRLQDLLSGLIDPPVPAAGGAAGFNWVFLVVALVVVVGLVLIVWRVGLPRWRPRTTDVEVETDPEVEPQQYRTASQRAADAGDWSGAIRERFRALVRELEHRTIIDPRPGRTALEAAGTAARLLPEVEPALHTAARLFNDVMYGELEADAEGYARMTSIDGEVREAAGQFRHHDPTDEHADDRTGVAP